MAYLQRSKARPSLDNLKPGDARFVHEHFDPYAGEVIINGQPWRWDEIETVEVVKSPRAAGPAGWIVRYLVHGDERYHVGIYAGRREAVLPNVRLDAARYVVQTLAFYAPMPVQYSGPDGLAPLTES